MIIKCYNCFKDFDDKCQVCPHCGHIVNSDSREEQLLPRGSVVMGRYLIGKACGYNGVRAVYKALDKQQGMLVTVTEYLPKGLMDRIPGTQNVVKFTGSREKEFDAGLSRFLEEARCAAKYASNKNIVSVLSAFEANKTAYSVTEYLEGITLEEFLETSTGGTGRLELDQALDIADSLCNAVKALHSDGILHKGIAPNSIFLCFGGDVKLTDFSLAQLPSESSEKFSPVFKPGYAPVEQYIEKGVRGTWTDVYAIGAVLYKLLTGTKPVEAIERQKKDPLKEPSAINPSVPKYLSTAIMRAMAVEKQNRLQTVEALEKILSSKKKVRSVNSKKRTKVALKVLAACVVIAAVGGGGVFGFLKWKQIQEARTLPEAKITVWYVSDNAEIADAMLSIKSSFCKKYDKVKIELVGVKSGEFEKRYKEASKAGNAPELFCSDYIDTARYKVMSLKSIYEKLDKDDFYFIGKSKAVILADNKMPMGFNIPVFCVNNSESGYAGTIVSRLSDLLGNDGKLAIDDDMQESFHNYFSESFAPATMEQFLNAEAAALFTNTSKYFKVRESLPGQFTMLPMEGSSITGTFTNCWSISADIGKDEEKIAKRLLEFMLDENAQDSFYVRNQNPGLPINKTVADAYKGVYQNDAQNLFVNMDAYTMIMHNAA